MSQLARLERPSNGQESMDFWIDEAIWGHRLHDEQSPWLTVLECLGVAYSEYSRGRAFEEPPDHWLSYTPLLQLRLRNILFNNPRLPQIAQRYSNSDQAWKAWQDEMALSAGGMSAPDFGYLVRHFNSFGDFATVVQFLRGSSVEGPNNKRWSSQFAFPFGPSALYEDLNIKPGGGSTNDRRFFARTGELLYLMLCRSGRGVEIRNSIAGRFFQRSGKYAQLISVLQGHDESAKNERSGAYLPYVTLPDYDALAADWVALLSRALPAYDVLPHLVTITGLHMLLYFLRRAHDECRESAPLSIVLEIVAPVRTKVRDLSCDSYAHNDRLSQRALEAHIARITEDPQWKVAVASADPQMNTRELLSRRFLWPGDRPDLDLPKDPVDLLDVLKERALVRHFGHVAKIHGTWGRAIGLSSRRSSRATRYAPTDSLLKTLVICCVDGRMELREFTELLHRKYGIVIGDQQAPASPETAAVDPEMFADNLARLEERLMSLGVLRRLSDQCAYVENPFAVGDTQ